MNDPYQMGSKPVLEIDPWKIDLLSEANQDPLLLKNSREKQIPFLDFCFN